MKNITIGLAGCDWTPVKSARFYAQRGNDGDYAFGKSTSDALANLERREMSSKAFDEDLAEEVAFLALGAADFLRTKPRIDLSRFGGYMGAINEVIRCAPLLADHWREMGNSGFDGVWLYDVTERFGREWTEALLDQEQQCPKEFLKYIVSDESQKWENGTA